MFRQRGPLIIFAGASLSLPAGPFAKEIKLFPPIKRGDLAYFFDDDPATILILDGIFGSHLAVTPTECRQLLEKGWALFGAASMGALRAADLWSEGMIGIGRIYTLFRMGLLLSDAEVAVAYGAEGREISLSLVHVRAVLQFLENQGVIEALQARQLLMVARTVRWEERDINTILSLSPFLSSSQQQHLENALRNEGLHPKRRDAKEALLCLLAGRWVH